MEEKYGVMGTMHDGIFFTESAIAGASILRKVSAEVSKQNANLTDVKSRLARDASKIGATVVMRFRYGQRKHPWWQNALSLKWDTESWHGEGDATRL